MPLEPDRDGQAVTDAAGSRLAARLRLKRVFLLALVFSLGTCALIAVIVLLVGEFNEFSAKVLLTLVSLAVHSGVAMVCAHGLERQRQPALNTLALVLFAGTFCLVTGCLWWPGGLSGQAFGRAAATTGTLLAGYILSVPGADLFERRVRRPLSGVALGVCAAAWLMWCVCIWAEDAENEAFLKATLVASVVAFALAHTCLLVRVPGGGVLGGLLSGTMSCLWLLAALVSGLIITEADDEFWFRLMGALGVLSASGSLALLILAKLRQVGRRAALQTTAARVELHCPRCTAAQTVDAGASACAACGLKFRIEIEEPRCAKCGYVLWQLPTRRCPECGTAF